MATSIRTPIRLNKKEEKVSYIDGQIHYDYLWNTKEEHDMFFFGEHIPNSSQDTSLKPGAV